MRKYIKYKNFTPIEVINNFEKENYTNNKKLIVLLLILNIICLPRSFKIIKEIVNKKNIEIKESIPVISKVEEDTNKNNLYKIINYINGDTIFIEFKNNNGTIEVSKKDYIFNIEKESRFFIHSINKINEEKFILEVSLWIRKLFI